MKLIINYINNTSLYSKTWLSPHAQGQPFHGAAHGSPNALDIV